MADQVAQYDVVVIGAGSTGENVADRVVQGGLTAAVVEAELVGGDCSYWACMPSKVLLRSGAAARSARAVPGLQVQGPEPTAVLAARDAMTSHWSDDGQVSWLESAGIDLVRGTARLAGEREVVVTTAEGEVHLRARHAVVISSGSAALVPPIPGLAESAPWTSREATSATSAPARLAVIGAGVVGCEMASAWTDLGSTVTLLARSGLLGDLEDFAGELVGTALTERGADVRTGVEVSEVLRGPSGVSITLGDGSEIEVDEVLVATGRTPRTGELGLEEVGLNSGDWLEVDDTLRVLVDGEPVAWLYGVGDVNHRALLTHQGKYQARAAGDVIVARATGGRVDDADWGAHVATADREAVPQVVFTDPEVASVGLVSTATRGREVTVVDYDLASLAGTSVHAEGYTGHARLVVDPRRQVVLGATFVGSDVAELLQAATVAVVGEVPISRLWHAVPAYPTISEVWLRLLEALGRETARHR